MSQHELGAAIGVAQSDVSRWESGEPPRKDLPTHVFGLEKAVGAPPGTLARLLGFGPAVAEPVSVEAAVMGDDRFSDAQKALLLALIAELAG